MSSQSTLYDQDFDRWAKNQVELLRQGRTNDLDIEHLIAELEDMGKGSLREPRFRQGRRRLQVVYPGACRRFATTIGVICV